MPAAPRHSQPSVVRGTRLTIGRVIALLEPDFPDLTVSKIRYLETEGLLTPQRSGSGYRRYSEADVERLRYILTVQREHFWPLRVIREALEARDRGEQVAAVPSPPRRGRFSAQQLAHEAGADPELVDSLISVGLLVLGSSGRFGAEDLQIVESVVWLQEYGLEPRHLRSFKASADREVGLIEQMLAPSAPGRAREAQAAQIAQHLLAIHGALITRGLGGAVPQGRAQSTVER